MSDTASEIWFEREPERREWELAEFARRGLGAEQRVVADALTVKTSLTFRGEDIEIIVWFPDAYPDVAPTIFGPAVLPRHQVLTRPMGNFCLLEQPDADWWPSMAAAELVDVDLRRLLHDTEQGSDAVAEGEADMPEPVSGHVKYEPGKAVLVPDPFWALELSVQKGELTLQEVRPGLSWIVTHVEGLDDPSHALIAQYSAKKGNRHLATWTSVAGVSGWPTAADLLNAAVRSDSTLLRRHRKALKQDGRRSSADGWVAVTFLEEGPYRGQKRRAWVPLNVRLSRRGEPEVLGAMRAQALTANERARRVPELTGLDRARALIVGAGSLGAPITLELAKAGVGRLDVLDVDFYDVNNAVRHPVSTLRAGANKEQAVVDDGKALNPFVDIRPHRIEVAASNEEDERLDALLRESDLVIDTTGSQSVARVLQRHCRAHAKPLLVASLTAGSYGGEVAVFRPEGPCFFCFVLAQDAGTIPTPHAGPRSNVTPVGCSHPAFSGAGFDASTLASIAARLAVTATGKCTYPAPGYDYVVVNFRGDDPWQQGRATAHPGCPLCS